MIQRSTKVVLTRAKGFALLDVQGLATLAIDITGTFVGTVVFEYTINSTDWYDLTSNIVNSSTTVTGATAVGKWKVDVSGYQAVRVRCSAFTSGSITVALRAVLSGVSLPQAAAAGAAGEAHLGAVGGNQVAISVTPTLTVHATYVANDFVGTSTTPITFTGAARVNNGSGVIQSAVLVDGAVQSVPAELWLFDTAVTVPADSAAWTISDADAAHLIGVIPFSAYYASALNSVAPVNNLGIAFTAVGGAKDIYGALVTRGAPTYASGDVTIKLQILQD